MEEVCEGDWRSGSVYGVYEFVEVVWMGCVVYWGFWISWSYREVSFMVFRNLFLIDMFCLLCFFEFFYSRFFVELIERV